MSSDEFEIDFTPDTDMLVGQSESPLGWKKCLCELIDNSLDAKATGIRITFNGNNLTIEDDGIGCNDVDAFFQQGKHKSRGGLGKFGVGLKDASLWLWGTTEVRSVSATGGVQCAVDWNHIVKTRKWSATAHALPEAGPSTGTRIVFSNIKKRPGPSDNHIADLGYWFFPAITSGRHIVIKKSGKKRPIPVPAFQFPPLDNVIECESEVAGKKFSVRAGVVQDGHPNSHPGFTIAYKHRVITTTTEGCGGFGTARFVGIVQLDSKWKLSRHKDELVEDAALLAETLYLICKDVLSVASEQSRIVALAGIEAEIADNLQDALDQQRKEARGKGKSKGTVLPKNTGITRKRATRTRASDDKSGLTSRMGGKINVQFVHGLKVLGKADTNENGVSVSLSAGHPYVTWAREHADVNTLTVLAGTILAIDAAAMQDGEKRQRLLPGIAEDDMRDRAIAGIALYTRRIKPAAKAK